jgi:methyl-accepting chemotaxis protein
MKAGFKRRKYPIVFRQRQYFALLLILVYAGSLCTVLFAGLFVPDIVVMQDEGADLALRAAAADRLLSLHARLWPAVLALVCLIGLHSFRMFARVVGPLFRFRQAFKEMGTGDMDSRVRLRAGDALMPEADAFNAMADSLCAKIGRWQRIVDDVSASAARLAALRGDASDEGAAALVHLQQQIGNLSAAAGEFTLAPDEDTPADGDAPPDAESPGTEALSPT